MGASAVPTWREIGQKLGLVARAHALTPLTETFKRKRHEVVASSAVTRSQVTTISTVGWSIVRGQQPSEFQQSGAEVRKLGWERHPVVNACARVVVDLIAAVPLEVFRRDAKGDATVLTAANPALDLLTHPRPDLSGARMIARTGMHLFLYGNAFWVLERRGQSNRGQPRSIRVVPPEDVLFVYLDPDTDAIVAYDWKDLQGKIHHREPVENVVHFRDLDATDGLFGFPRLASALLDIAADTEASQYVRQIVTNHGAPGIAVIVDGVSNLPDLQAAETAWREKYTTRGHRGMTAFVSGVKEIQQIGFDLKELEFPDLRKVSRESICAASGVDPRMISVSTATSDGGLSGEQYREARFRLIQQTVWPLMRVIENELNHWFMPEYGEPEVRFSEEYIAAISEDITQTSTRVLAELAAKARTVEETREAIGLEAEMDPTHTLPGGMTVGDTAKNAQEMAAATLEKTKNPPPIAPNGAATPSTKPTPLALVKADHTFSPLALIRSSSLAAETERWETQFERAALLLFAAEAADIARIFAALSLADAVITDTAIMRVMQRVNQGYTEGGEYQRAWLERYSPLIGRAVQAGGRDIAGGAGLDFTLENPRVRGIVARRTADLVHAVTDTTREAIRAALVAARAQGLSVRQTAKLIEDTTFGAITKSRANLIARNEVLGALTSGEYAAAVQSGVMRSKTWLTQGDERVRDSHVALDGVTVDLGAAFPNGLRYPHDPLGAPEERHGCRCALTYSDLEAGAARA